ncbi:MAG: hypothetical protein CBC59_002700 [Euryarchaeota archaeon TMED99]|nr:MAG: hypothetical protein CBC59_002700 [Euryarchaeota archaeon TMED99]
MSEELTVESRIAPPALSCPKCDGLLPNELGEVQCTLCPARVRVEHEVTRKKWAEEKIGCPDCAKVLVVGVNKRPAHLKCASCDSTFTVIPKVARVEISCPGCERILRMKRRPGERQVDCPACDTSFKVTF